MKIAFFILAFSLVSGGVWYAVSFFPHLGELKALAARGEETIKDIKPVLYPIAVAGETKEGLRAYAIRQAYSSLVFEKNRSSMLSWHSNNVLWYIASHVHFTENEIFGIWVECALNGCGRGLQETSRKHFGKQLNYLSERELAGLVVLVKSPTRFAPGSEREVQRTNAILEKARTQ